MLVSRNVFHVVLISLAVYRLSLEFKHDVYGRRQTEKLIVTSDFLFFSCNPLINHSKIDKCLLLFTANKNVFTLLYRQLKTDGESFIFVVCCLT